jgi:putative peptidoglycan lipid II flippase
VYKVNADTGKVIAKLFLSAGLMAALVQFAKPDMRQWYDWGLLDSSLCLFGLIGLAAISYFMALLVFGLRPRHFKISD